MEAVTTSLGSGLAVVLRLVGDKRVWVSLPEEPSDVEVVGLSTGWAVLSLVLDLEEQRLLLGTSLEQGGVGWVDMVPESEVAEDAGVLIDVKPLAGEELVLRLVDHGGESKRKEM